MTAARQSSAPFKMPGFVISFGTAGSDRAEKKAQLRHFMVIGHQTIHENESCQDSNKADRYGKLRNPNFPISIKRSQPWSDSRTGFLWGDSCLAALSAQCAVFPGTFSRELYNIYIYNRIIELITYNILSSLLI